MRSLSIFALGLMGCVHARSVNPEDACVLVAASRVRLEQGVSTHDLYQLSLRTPFASDGRSAYAQEVTAKTAGWGLGTGALFGAFIVGFATDQSQRGPRIATITLASTGMAMTALYFLLNYTSGRKAESTRRAMIDWSSQCAQPLPNQ